MLLNDEWVDNAKAIKRYCMLDLNPRPKSSSFKEIHNKPETLKEAPLKPNQETITNAKGTNDFVGVKNRNDKSIRKESEFVVGQKVFYFPKFLGMDHS